MAIHRISGLKSPSRRIKSTPVGVRLSDPGGSNFYGSVHMLGMTTLTAVRPATQIRRNLRWAISDGSHLRPRLFAEASWSAAWIVDETMRALLAGQTVQLSVRLQDQLLGVLWDATPDVNAVLAATGWPTRDGDTLELRATVMGIIRDILVSDDTPTDVPPQGISDPHTYALVCR